MIAARKTDLFDLWYN